MENFIVSARKYRPSTFSSVVGQPAITTTLKNAILNNQLAQAFLFCGPRGVGKTTCARILAKTINCLQISSEGEACNECVSCKSFNTSASFNIYELDAASNNSVDDIRSLVDQVRIPPQAGKYKVYIIDEVHMLSASAFNAFLKTLEEPPAYAKFILATTEKHKIIPTVLSRCQIFDFKRISVEDIIYQLNYVADQEGVKAESEALHIIAQKADGALRDALSMFDQLVSFGGRHLTYHQVIANLNVLDYDYYFLITDCLLENRLPDTLLLLDEIVANGFDGQHFITGMGEHLRSLLVSQDIITLRLLEAGASLKERYQMQTKRCQPVFLLKAIEIANRSDIDYRMSNNKRLHIELAILQMGGLLHSTTGIETKRIVPIAQVAFAPAPLPFATTSTPPVPDKPIEHKPDPPVKKTAPLPAFMPGTISIKQIEPESPQKQTLPFEADTGDTENGDNEEIVMFITQPGLEKHWTAFAQSVAGVSPNLHATLTSSIPKILDAVNGIIEYPVNGKVQQKEINDHKMTLLDYLKKKLEVSRLTLHTPIVESARVNEIPYTPIEKYRKMVEKNPVLAKMKEQLNLDIDF
ncbi:MAG: DNA polymerase III subunit gamma/tau [Bacteroidales bacterium]|nr:DNA polymerase III subunit gamma/tau [Bacteroidales bacterium]MDZ4204331.1 DNA polymerase III subunit gamma/tau [Bacteroidales bacterium]